MSSATPSPLVWSRHRLGVVLGLVAFAACGKAATGVPNPDTGSGNHGSSSGGSGSGVDATTGLPGDTSDAGDVLEAGDQAETGALSDATGDAILDGGPAAVVCPDASLAAGDYTNTLVLEGGVRSYSIHVPAGLDPTKPAPLVFAFHGGGQTAAQFEGFANVHAKSDSSGFILIEPEGTPALPGLEAGVLDVWNAGNCCELAAQPNDNVDDVGFVGAMLDSVTQQTCIDPKRIFATGFSNGGMLSHRLACQMSDRFAAITSVSGGIGQMDLDKTPPVTLFPCSPGRPVPVLHIHGTQDACYPFDGGWGPLSLVTFESVMTTINGWIALNGCSSGPPTNVFANGAVSCNLYPCPHQGDVELCVVDGGGHYWPGGGDWAGSEIFCGAGQGIRSADIIANDAFWAWFQAHPMP